MRLFYTKKRQNRADFDSQKNVFGSKIPGFSHTQKRFGLQNPHFFLKIPGFSPKKKQNQLSPMNNRRFKGSKTNQYDP